MRKSKGITLIALIVTIVVLLILAGITINTVIGDKGLISRANDAKVQMEIANEKEIVARAQMLTVIRSKGTEISYDVFEPALQEEAGGNNVEASDAGDIIDVFFPDTNRYYEVDKNGNVTGPNEVVNDENAGDITKGGRCDGSEEKPYEISCIEDLVAFSNIVNGSGIKFVNGQKVDITVAESFANKYVILTRNLNFKSKYSYVNSERTDFGNLNNNDTDGNSLITEMTTGTGFNSIGNHPKLFDGNFNGKNYTIANIYINTENGARALFGTIGVNSCISNLTITGKIKTADWNAAGIVAQTQGGTIGGTISNCVNKADVTGYNMVGGIAYGFIKNINNCKNYGTIEITGKAYQYGGAGGIVGVANNSNEDIEIYDCINYGLIKGNVNKGGIAGTSTGNTTISNCRNEGEIESGGGAGGILGWQRGRNIKNIKFFK